MTVLRACALAVALLLTACADRHAPAAAEAAPRPQQAGQPLDPLTTAARMVAIRGAAVMGDQDAVRQQMDAMSHDLQRAMRLPDPARRIAAEPARQLAAAVDGVSSAAWVDPANLLAMVDGAQYRDHATIDRICVALEPLGDTLWVNVHLQDRQAGDGEGLDILSRNCQLPPGESAFGQHQRRMNVVEPAVRMAHQTTTAKMRDAQARKAEDDRANAAALRNIPEM
ncbi:hypothetical protein [Thermomonas fusca]|uniref:Lipoprotein n=1 Tax=Thermomonas fusca TaxID=215690 RepID=A0A5R9PHJ7_9GAMM|nr:hypothetical protein [Thermomonas fusca]TLX22969.1 hypothetical protein E5S66_02805 [Thermomonas fusca]